MYDEKFDLNEVDHSRFVKPVSDEELKSLVENILNYFSNYAAKPCAQNFTELFQHAQ
jgi:hypothetical protein